MEFDISIFFATCLILLVLSKAIETSVNDIYPNLKFAKDRLRGFYLKMAKEGDKSAVENYIKLRNPMILNRSVSQGVSIYLSNYFYRWFLLTPLLSFATLWFDDKFTKNFASATIVFSIWIEIANVFIDRFWNGIASNIQFGHHVDVAKTDHLRSLNTSEMLKGVGISLVIRVAVIWIGFASIYLNLMKVSPEPAFNKMEDFIDALYFSLVTITTTGYGDIVPTTMISKAAVTCQIGLSWVLLIVTVFHYGTTISKEFKID